MMDDLWRSTPEPEPEPEAEELNAVAPSSYLGGRAPDDPGGLEREIERLQAELAEQKQLARKYAFKAHQAQVEIERAKQRIERDACKENEQRHRVFLVCFLDVLDNLDRALRAARAVGDAAVVEGVELVRRNFVAKLADHGVSHFVSFGATFDPSRHEALSRVPVDDPAKDGKVVAVIQEGFVIGAETLRAALVAVGQYAASG